jgi:hypothetical protein
VSGFESRAAAALADPHKRANVPRFAERAADNRVRGLGGTGPVSNTPLGRTAFSCTSSSAKVLDSPPAKSIFIWRMKSVR